ncbi:MAG TPA: ribonuclease PH [Bdellovibrionales bacterium]|nr:ribonuclease PH [Bdellovibrionales bacterium]
MRLDHRKITELRPVTIQAEVIRHAEGSVQIDMGFTRVLCTASVEPGVPKWLQGTGQGWVTAEYGMLPRSTHSRISREKAMNSGRTQEISRLIGRSLRAAVDLKALGERQITVDCDVLQADGGTRTAAVTGGFVALALALNFLKNQGAFPALPLKSYVAAVSVGLLNDGILLDLNYEEDSACGVDMNFVLTSREEFVEVQGTGEGSTFTKTQMDAMSAAALAGCRELFGKQAAILGRMLPL